MIPSRSTRTLQLCALASLVAACTGKKPEEPRAAPIPIRSSVEAPPQVALHPSSAHARPDVMFSDRAGGVAELVEQGDRTGVVHNGAKGSAYAAVGEVALSPDGRRCAHGALEGTRWRMVVDGKAGAPYDAVRRPVFSPDGAHLAYQAMKGERWLLVVDATPNAGTRTRFLDHAFGGDPARIVFVDDVDDRERGRLVVADLAFLQPVVVATGVSSFTLDPARTRGAAIATSGKTEQVVLSFSLAHPDRVERGKPYDAVKDLLFGADGTLAYVAERGGRSLLVLGDREVPFTPAALVERPVVVPGKAAFAALVAGPSGGVRLREIPGPEAQRDATAYDEAEGLVISRDGGFHAYAARRGGRWFAVLNGKEGPAFDRVVTPTFSADGRWLAYRARRNGSRFVVVVATSDGAAHLHGAHEQVFPVSFGTDGATVAYGVKDGAQAAWMVEAP
jgi:hypothetical protein